MARRQKSRSLAGRGLRRRRGQADALDHQVKGRGEDHVEDRVVVEPVGEGAAALAVGAGGSAAFLDHEVVYGPCQNQGEGCG